jgi:hypothetical protein
MSKIEKLGDFLKEICDWKIHQNNNYKHMTINGNKYINHNIITIFSKPGHTYLAN